ncbi:hypothetical protein [Photobacterium leiognathi]|uniref:hypothetical protein n=1 Tax=Photobacterium leiognathi TaxID=553611 RepID=UPI0029810866|nr:hypothetical protein [Photobacterium leiognathi]
MYKYIKFLLGGLVTIVLGAIGSGLWERFLSDAFDKLVLWSINVINIAFTSYKDGIYASAAMGFHENYSLLTYAFIISILPVAYYWAVLRHPARVRSESKVGETSPSKMQHFMRSRKGYWIIVGMTFSVFAFCLHTTAKMRYTNEVLTYSLRSLDIIEPYVSEHDFKLLRSKFYQVKTTAQFEAFYSEVNNVAKSKSLELPKNNLM